MDIRKWLDETVLPQQPPSPIETPRVPRARPEAPERSSRKKRKRKLSTSDSSLLAAPSRRKTSPPVELEESTDDSAQSDASHPTSSGGSSSSQPYARKPRRKTRPERYEPTVKDGKERGMHGRRHQKEESTKTKRKNRRKKADKQSSIAQNFHAKNVPKDRLILKPHGKPGLFNKGRASSPVKARGLPDLVFSEMKFLQSQRAQAEPGARPEKSKKKAQKDRSHAKEAEISAYFAAVRPALAERDVNTQAKEGSPRERRPKNNRRKQQSTSAVDNTIPTVESTDNASYLGFRSRGPCHGSGSYISWSESIRAPSNMPAHGRMGSTSNTDQLDSIHDKQTKGTFASREALDSQDATTSVIRRMPDGSRARFQVSSLAPANSRPSRSHSLPQHTSSPQRINLIDRAAKRQTTESINSPLSMPPFVPEPGNPQDQCIEPSYHDVLTHSRDTDLPSPQQETAPHGTHHHGHKAMNVTSEERDAEASSSLGRLILDCNTKFNEMRRTNAATNAEPAPSNIRARGSGRALHGPLSAVERTPTVRFIGVEEVRPPLRPSYSGPVIYEQPKHGYFFDQKPVNRNFDVLQEPYLDEDEYFDAEEMDYDGQSWGLETEAMFHGVDFTGLPVDLDEAYEEEQMRGRTDMASTAASQPGFWRPHKLY